MFDINGDFPYADIKVVDSEPSVVVINVKFTNIEQ